jgi:hypothetical protein
LDGINDDAFSGLPNGIQVNLGRILFGYLNEMKFRGLLDVVAEDDIYGGLVVGGLHGCDPIEPECVYTAFTCDHRIDWVCADFVKYRNRLRGYFCKYDGSWDIWDYCSN